MRVTPKSAAERILSRDNDTNEFVLTSDGQQIILIARRYLEAIELLNLLATHIREGTPQRNRVEKFIAEHEGKE